MKLIAKLSDDTYLIRLENAACVVDGRTYRELQLEGVNENGNLYEV